MIRNPVNLEKLLLLANPQGGWGYQSGCSPQPEPTALALLALAGHRSVAGPALERGLTQLLGWQDSDGAFRVQQGRPEAVWPTTLALLVLAALDEAPAARDRAVAWLLHLRGEELDDPAAYRRDFDIDPDLIGWPWTEGTFSWTEPTAWACLALRLAGWGDQPRVQEGLRMLLDRSFDTGGLNCGNRCVFGRPTEPVPSMSAVMLLACAGLEDHPRLRAARQYALHVAEQSEDLEHLSWMRLALEPWRKEPAIASALPDLEKRLKITHAQRQQSHLFGDSVMREALACLALNIEHHNPFRIPQESLPPKSLPEAPPPRAGTPLADRIASRLRGWGIRALNQLRALPAQTPVHVARAPGYDDELSARIREQYAAFRAQVPLAGKRVVLKPNLVEYHRNRVINTDPRFIGAVIDLCKQEGTSEVIVAEGPGHWRNTEYLVEASGLGDVLRQHAVRFVDLNHDDPIKTPNLGRLTGLEFLYLCRTIVEADVLISLPKLKTHHWAGVTLSLKNLFGTMPGICYGWPKNELHWRGIENSIVDIALTRTPDLAIVDGVIGMEGDGPLNGEPVPLGVIIMGSDPLAVDATCCRLMQLDPEKVGHLRLGHSRRLGLLPEARIQQIGEAIAPLSKPFATIPRFEVLHAGTRSKGQTA